MQAAVTNGTPQVDLFTLLPLPLPFERATDYALGVCTAAQDPDQAHAQVAPPAEPAAAQYRRTRDFAFERD